MKSMLLIMTMAFVINASAGDRPTLRVVEDKTFVLNINDWKNSELNISFINDKGEEIYSEKLQPSKIFFKEFNLQILRKGTYRMEVSRDSGKITYEIKITDQRISRISEVSFTDKSDAISMDIVSKIKSIH